MIFGKNYRPNLVQSEYDYIIIGSGISGLALATFLSTLKYKVVVFEQHYTAGGLTHAFKRKKFKWDVGVHYIGEVNDKNSKISKIFNFLTDGELKWKFMGEDCDRVILNDFNCSLSQKELIAKFPAEKKEIQKFYQLMENVYWSASLHFINRAFPKALKMLTKKLMGVIFRKYRGITLKEVLDQFFSDQKLKNILSGIYGDYGLPPSQASFVAHAMVAHHYKDGGSYPVGGSENIAKTIIDKLDRYKTDVFVRAKVKRILVKNESAYGVELFDGKVINGRRIISTVGYFVTFKKLLKNKYQTSFLQKLQPSGGFFCSYIGLKDDVLKEKIPMENFWYFNNQDFDHSFDKNEIPYLFISFAGKREPKSDSHTVTLLTNFDYQKVSKWDKDYIRKRPQEYINLKKDFEGKCLKIFFELFPELKNTIEYIESSTPLTNKYYSNNLFGEPYGLAPTCDRFISEELKPETDIKNLYMSGCDNIMGGVTPALISSLQTLLSLHPIKASILIQKITK